MPEWGLDDRAQQVLQPRGRNPAPSSAGEAVKDGLTLPARELDLANAIPLLAPMIARLDRYEQRALSRRKTAIGRFMLISS